MLILPPFPFIHLTIAWLPVMNDIVSMLGLQWTCHFLSICGLLSEGLGKVIRAVIWSVRLLGKGTCLERKANCGRLSCIDVVRRRVPRNRKGQSKGTCWEPGDPIYSNPPTHISRPLSWCHRDRDRVRVGTADAIIPCWAGGQTDLWLVRSEPLVSPPGPTL